MIGKTNVGKSTLLNSLVQKKISITSSKKQTTRSYITGICHAVDYQLVFKDTPGIHLQKNVFFQKIDYCTLRDIENIDIVLLVVEQKCSFLEQKILNFLQQYKKKVILVINKIDLLKSKMAIDSIILSYLKKFTFDAVVPVSSFAKKNIDILKQQILFFVPEGESYFSKNTITTLSRESLIADLVREKILFYIHKEIPHLCKILVENIKKKENYPSIIEITVIIMVDKDNHKQILIGKKGHNLKRIGIEARRDINKILNMHIYLNLWVKVKKKRNKNKK
nr:GTPase Era [Candidatus Phytoplasma phoenicium]